MIYVKVTALAYIITGMCYLSRDMGGLYTNRPAYARHPKPIHFLVVPLCWLPMMLLKLTAIGRTWAGLRYTARQEWPIMRTFLLVLIIGTVVVRYFDLA